MTACGRLQQELSRLSGPGALVRARAIYAADALPDACRPGLPVAAFVLVQLQPATAAWHLHMWPCSQQAFCV